MVEARDQVGYGEAEVPCPTSSRPFAAVVLLGLVTIAVVLVVGAVVVMGSAAGAAGSCGGG